MTDEIYNSRNFSILLNEYGKEISMKNLQQ